MVQTVNQTLPGGPRPGLGARNEVWLMTDLLLSRSLLPPAPPSLFHKCVSRASPQLCPLSTCPPSQTAVHNRNLHNLSHAQANKHLKLP